MERHHQPQKIELAVCRGVRLRFVTERRGNDREASVLEPARREEQVIAEAVVQGQWSMGKSVSGPEGEQCAGYCRHQYRRGRLSFAGKRGHRYRQRQRGKQTHRFDRQVCGDRDAPDRAKDQPDGHDESETGDARANARLETVARATEATADDPRRRAKQKGKRAEGQIRAAIAVAQRPADDYGGNGQHTEHDQGRTHRKLTEIIGRAGNYLLINA